MELQQQQQLGGKPLKGKHVIAYTVKKKKTLSFSENLKQNYMKSEATSINEFINEGIVPY